MTGKRAKDNTASNVIKQKHINNSVNSNNCLLFRGEYNILNKTRCRGCWNLSPHTLVLKNSNGR